MEIASADARDFQGRRSRRRLPLRRVPVTGPALFDKGTPPLTALLAACADGRAQEAWAEIERHRAQHPDDPRAEALLRLIAAAGPNYAAALQLLQAEVERARAPADEEIQHLLGKQEQQA